MELQFEKLSLSHQQPVMELFNYYIDNSFAAFPDTAVPEVFFSMMLEKVKGYPAYALKVDHQVVGFCFLSAFNPFSTFKVTAAVSYFLAPHIHSKGYGTICLKKLEEDAKAMGIHSIIAEISSLNRQSIHFHEKNGFELRGTLKGVGIKKGQGFDLVIMQKSLA